ncbi:MAG TPA: hypothetical protein VNJ07_11435 [Chitinophagales bacterium]|nr:hypothetical protein [Chitinophagales bacterium]
MKARKWSRQLSAAAGRGGLPGIAFSLIMAAFTMQASDIGIITKLDTSEILIGDQVKFSLEVIRDKQTQIVWPHLGSSIKIDSVREIEILSFRTDTVQQANQQKEIRTYTLTVFDSGYYVIPPIVLKYKDNPGDSFSVAQSEPMLLTVKSMEVDTAAPIKPIKEPLTMPFHISEILKELLIGAGVLALITGLILYFSLRKKKPVLIKRFVRKEPPHEIALNKLRALEEKKLWQQGEVKRYYSELSEIIREYIERRFDIPALESTTDEIMARINVTGITGKLQDEFRLMLQTSDLVKFAKAYPVPDEHTRNLAVCYELVKATKTDEQVQNVEVTEMAEPSKQ